MSKERDALAAVNAMFCDGETIPAKLWADLASALPVLTAAVERLERCEVALSGARFQDSDANGHEACSVAFPESINRSLWCGVCRARAALADAAPEPAEEGGET